jgi:hypothetical protein
MAKVGRPLKFKTVEELKQKMDKYFKDTPKEKWSITGLALALDTDRITLIRYGKKDEFSNTLKEGKTKVENSYELRLIDKGRSGDIFALKNFGWTDKIQQENTGDINFNIRIIGTDG